MNRFAITILFFSMFFSLVHAIVIVPPVVYFATLSIATFISNSIIALLALLAVSGIVNKKVFGKKISELFSAFFSGIKIIFISLFSMLISIFIIWPIELISIIQGSLVAALICFCFLFISDYSKFRIVNKERKSKIIKSSLIFSIIILFVFGISANFSTSIEILTNNSKESYQSTPFDDVLSSVSDSMGVVASESLVDQAYKSAVSDYDYAEEKSKIILSEIWFYPENKSDCIVQLGTQKFTFTPEFSCFVYENSVPSRIFCPVKISADKVLEKGKINASASGSCIDSFEVIVSNDSFEVVQ